MDSAAKEMFSARVEALLNLISNYENWESVRVDIVQTRADLLYRHAVRLGSLGIVEESTIEKLRDIVDLLVCRTEECSVCFQTDLECSGLKGRPKFRITAEQLSHMTENGLKTVHIASMLGVSERTVRRRLSEFGIDSTGTFSDIDDLTLDTTIRSLQVQFPNSGYRMMLGHLRARGLKIQQTRVRESMQRTDPCGTVLRWFQITERRSYNVASPNALWHIDGNHKLVR